MAAISALKISAGTTLKNFASDRLKTLIERIERLEQEKADLASDVRDVYVEAKSAGFEPKVMRQIIRLRKMDSDARMEQEELLDLYKSTLGMI